MLTFCSEHDTAIAGKGYLPKTQHVLVLRQQTSVEMMMINKTAFLGLVAGMGIALSGMTHAATVATNTILTNDGSAFVLAPNGGTTGTVSLNVQGNDLNDGAGPNTAPYSRSPFDGTAFEETGYYNSVSSGSSATYLTGLQSLFSILWGSPDDYNDIVFFLGGLEVFALNGTDVDNPPAPGTGFVNVTVSNFLFDTVVLTSTNQDAFEYAGISAVPLPAGGLLLISGLGALAAARRRKAA